MHRTFFRLFIGLLFSFIAYACDDLQSVIIPNGSSVQGTGALYILCDGNFSLNNSTLAVYDFTEGKLTKDYFQDVNERKLGDTGNDLQQYGSKLYVIVNGSSQLEVLDAQSGLALRKLPFFDGNVARQPRYIAFWKDKAYVCSFDGTVAKIDTATLEVEGYLNVGRNPDGIAASNNKLYVSNSGGLDFNSTLGYDNTVSVISTEQFIELDRINVGSNPGQIQADSYGYVYVSVRGNYEDQSGKWVCIDTQIDEIFETYNLEVTRFDIAGDNAYFYCWNPQTHQNQIGLFNVRTKTLETLNFITDGTQLTTPYGLKVDAESGAVFITDAGDFISSGDVYCFNENGQQVYKISNVGVNPNTVLPIHDFIGIGNAHPDSLESDDNGIYQVFDFTPAPGQFVGVYPYYISAESKADMCQKVKLKLQGKTGGLVSLGGYGGSVTFSFRKAVKNLSGADFKVFGNAFLNSAEPGIVEVAEDVNGNGLPDDMWYELAGSQYGHPSTVHGYSITYYKPSNNQDSVIFKDNQNGRGTVIGTYPAWEVDSIVCAGTLIANSAYQNDANFWVLANLPWGYADNQPNISALTAMDLDWAVNASGQAVALSKIHFVRVYTCVKQNLGWLGELSTEITGAENLHP